MSMISGKPLGGQAEAGETAQKIMQRNMAPATAEDYLHDVGPSVKVAISNEARAMQMKAQEGERLSLQQREQIGVLFGRLDDLFGPDGERDLSEGGWDQVGAIFDELESVFDLESARSVLGEKKLKHVLSLEEELNTIFGSQSDKVPTGAEKKRGGKILGELVSILGAES